MIAVFISIMTLSLYNSNILTESEIKKEFVDSLDGQSCEDLGVLIITSHLGGNQQKTSLVVEKFNSQNCHFKDVLGLINEDEN